VCKNEASVDSISVFFKSYKKKFAREKINQWIGIVLSGISAEITGGVR
jgi:hypothetical protein